MDYEIDYRRMTAEDVLAALVEGHRHQAAYDFETDPTAELSFSTSVSEWRWACDLVQWRDLGRAMNNWFGLQYGDEVWRETLTPPKKKTLRDVCDVVARSAVRPVIRPITILGKRCAAGGAFLTLRSVLRRAGVDVEGLRPSTPLGPYMQRHGRTVLAEITKLAPGRLPTIEVQNPVYAAFAWGYYLSLGTILVGGVLQSVWPLGSSCIVIPAVFATGVSYLGMWLAAEGKHANIAFGNLRSFRDLSFAIVGTNNECAESAAASTC